MASLKARLEEIESLPALPSTVVRLIRGLSDNNVSAEELESIIKTDEAISAIVLRVANSAAQGQAGDRVFTLQESIARLGTRVLYKIAVSQQCSAVLADGGKGFGLMRGQLWIGALGGAIAADAIARQVGGVDASVCFVGGLLRDIGKLAMDRLVGADEMQRAFAKVKSGVQQIEIESEAFGLSHAEAGAELARIWGLPEEIARAIRYHHEPDLCEEGDQRLCDVVHGGDAIALWMGLGVGHDGLAYPISARAKEQLGLRRKKVETYMSAVKLELDKVMQESSAA